MSESTLSTLLAFFKALGNESRLKIVGLLANGEASVGELAEALSLREPTVSHHLAMLREVGLVQRQIRGNTHVYRLEMTPLEQMSQQVFTLESLASITPVDARTTIQQKVLRNFLDGERLINIPASRKKRRVILEWLADKFDRGRRYTEPEVNTIIKRHHPDSATLRRELVGCDLMTRERGVYWRLPMVEESIADPVETRAG